MSAPTMEELKALRAALAALEDRRDQAFNLRTLSVENAIAFDIAHHHWWTASCEYGKKLNAYLEAGKHEMVRV